MFFEILDHYLLLLFIFRSSKHSWKWLTSDKSKALTPNIELNKAVVEPTEDNEAPYNVLVAYFLDFASNTNDYVLFDVMVEITISFIIVFDILKRFLIL